MTSIIKMLCFQFVAVIMCSTVTVLANLKTIPDKRNIDLKMDGMERVIAALRRGLSNEYVRYYGSDNKNRKKEDATSKKYRLRAKGFGCYKDKKEDRIFSNMVAVNRDPSHPAFIPPLLTWSTLEFNVKSLVKSCAKLAMDRGYHWIGIQYYGECWSGPEYKGIETHRIPDASCLGTKPPIRGCDKYKDNYCAGQIITSFVYKLEKVEEVCPEKIDVGYLIDSSISIGETLFKKTLEFVAAMSEKIIISPDDAHFAVMHFSTKFFIDVSFGDEKYHNEYAFRRKLANIKKNYGYSFTKNALLNADKFVFCEKCGMRANVKKLLFVFTDGYSSEYHQRSFKQITASIKDKDVRIIVISIGEKVDMNNLRDIATSKIIQHPNGGWERYYYIYKFEEEYNIKLLARELAITACH